MSCPTRAFSTKTAISMSWSNTRSAIAEDLLIRISITNRGPDAAPIHVLPTLWFRNTWSWGRDPRRPSIAAGPKGRRTAHATRTLSPSITQLGEFILYCSGADELLFTENETNTRDCLRRASPTPYVKDAFHEYVVHGNRGAVNPASARHQSGRALHAHRRSRRNDHARLASVMRCAAIIRLSLRSPISTALLPAPARRRMSSTTSFCGDISRPTPN